MNITVQLTADERADLMQRAPSACGYWADMVTIYAFDAYAVTARDGAGDLPGRPLHKLTARGLDGGVAQYLASGADLRPVRHYGIGGLDKGAVDQIVQFALFGKLVFG